MALITPERLVALKEKVKEECKRRAHTGPVSQYSAPAYNFSVMPAKGTVILKEHYEKIAEPLNAITGDIDTNGARIISEAEIAAMEAKVEVLKNKELGTSQADSGCAASCTGLCTNDCVTNCNGCSGCSGCGEGCDGSCWQGCYTGCRGTCEGCTGGCGDECLRGCVGECAYGCGNSVSVGGSECSGNCTGFCTGECWNTASGGPGLYFICSSDDTCTI